jgi:DNA sulfur modification protein DndB
MEMTEQVPVLKGMIDKEKMSIPLRSPKLMTLSALYDANSELLGSVTSKPDSPEFREKLALAVEYWIAVAGVIVDWEKVRTGELRAPELRQEKISTHGVVLRALGALGKVLIEEYPEDWKQRLEDLRDIEWRKSVGSRVNPMWDNVCIVAGSVVSNRQARKATQAVLKRWLRLPLTNQERQILSSLESAGWDGPKMSGWPNELVSVTANHRAVAAGVADGQGSGRS